MLLPSSHRRATAVIVVAVSLSFIGWGCAPGRDKPVAGSPDSTPAAPGNPAFASFVDEYFAALYTFAPSMGTAAGLHEYDGRLEDFAAPVMAARDSMLKLQLASLTDLRGLLQSRDDSIDAQMIDGAIRSELQEHTELRSWRRNPMTYINVPGTAIDALIKRDFAPAPERLRNVISRLAGVAPMLAAMRANVDVPPREFTELAVRMAGGSVGFFRETLATWARSAAANDSALLKEFTTANENAARAMESAAKWLKNDLLPRSRGSYAIGAERFAKKLQYEEQVDIPLDSLLAIGEANLEKDYRAFVEVARTIDSTKAPAAVMALLENEHPNTDSLISFVKGSLEGARQFLIDKRIATVPSEVRPIVMETPPYARSGSFASMDPPGPFEAKATEAFYYVTPPEKDWDAKHTEEHLRLFNRPVVDMITIHEAFPGHYLQLLYAKQLPTKTRKLLGAASNIEGWAHYTEQMMVEEGYRNGDPKTRLAQLSEALLRDCRFVVGIKLHTKHMSVADGAKCFVERGFQQPANAYEEARRGAYNPTYLYYTLGKLQIYKLRDDYKRAKGGAYTLQGFHDAFVRQGGLPLSIVRRILIPGDTSRTL